MQVYGSDFGLQRATWISRFTDATRQAASYRNGRVLLAGDAAHVHPPQGGQGLNTGVQDAVNLGWKLARVVQGTAPHLLLDSYHSERHPVAARVLRLTMSAVALGRPGGQHQALRETLAPLLALEEPRRRLAEMLTALDVCYALGEGHPVVGRRMPDLELRGAGNSTSVSKLLWRARPVLLNLSSQALDVSMDRVDIVRAEAPDIWELPGVGKVGAPSVVLLRPDGHVAWAGEPRSPGLQEAIGAWC